MRLGIVQTNPTFGEINANLEQAFRLMNTGRAHLWVLPELFATGYQFVSRDEVRSLAEPVPDGRTTAALCDYAARQKTHIVAGLPERDGDRLFNAAILVGPDGLISRYRKVHLFYKETVHFDPGDLPFAVQDLGFARVGMMICFDHLFPESARSLSLLGADILCHPANLVMPDLAQQTMKVRALENGVFTATANRIGTETRDGEESLTYTGQSQIVAPDGTILARMEQDAMHAAVLEIDEHSARAKAITRFNDKLGDRRPDRYSLGAQAG